jgi:uncharacterized protein
MQNTAPTESAQASTDSLTTSLNQELSRVDAHVDDKLVGFSAYEICDDGSYSFHHTEVFEEYSGLGYGKELAAGVMQIARAHGFLIAPTCPFIRKYMDKNPDTQELRAA